VRALDGTGAGEHAQLAEAGKRIRSALVSKYRDRRDPGNIHTERTRHQFSRPCLPVPAAAPVTQIPIVPGVSLGLKYTPPFWSPVARLCRRS